MRYFVAVLFSSLFATYCWGANLRVDASKTIKPQSLQMKKLQNGKNSILQQKRYSTKLLKQAESRYQGKRQSPSINKASNTMSKLNQVDARIGQKESRRQPRPLEQVVKSSDAFEKAYNKALTLELSKRAAAQVEQSKIKKKKASQKAINRDARSRPKIEEGFNIQRVGQQAK